MTEDQDLPVHDRLVDGIGWITLDRPEVRNALNAQVLDLLEEAIGRLAEEPECRVLVFTGAGDKAFAAGADIHELARRRPVDGLRARMQRVYDLVEDFRRPTIAAVNGYAFGGGHELALACDIRICSTNAQFALPETGLGIMPAAGGTRRLARLIGVGRATEMILTGRRVGAEEALQMGLVTQVTAREDLEEAVRELATTITARGPLAVELATTVVRHGFDADHATAMLLERLAQSVLYSTEEKAEGTRAFLERRAPEFIPEAARDQEDTA